MTKVTTVTHIFTALVLLLCSWAMLFEMLFSVRGVSLFAYRGKECLSIVLCITSYAVLFLPVYCQWIRTSSTFQRRNACAFFFVSIMASMSLHMIVHMLIAERHRQTQELMLLLGRFTTDIIMFACGCGFVLGPVWQMRCCFFGWRRVRRSAYFPLVDMPLRGTFLIVMGAFVMLTFFFMILLLFVSGNAKRFLEVGMLGDYIDFCGLEGFQLSREAATGWVLPEYTHRRLLNAYTGSDRCGSNTISFLDEDEAVLIVSPRCPSGGEQPKVYIERPERSEMNGGVDVLEKTLNMSRRWHQELEERYGTDETVHRSKGVCVNRDARGVIRSVEILSSHLNPVLREPRTAGEKIARASWPSEKVWVVPLGESVAYSVYCPTMDYEEYHMYPPIQRRERGEKRLKGNKGDPKHSPASVLLLVFDAVSRQEVLRSLPKFSNWLRAFRENTSSGHIFVEAQGATTLAHSTQANLVPLFTGNIPRFVKREAQQKMMKTSLFRLVKEKYGNRFSTSYTIGDCFDMMQLFGRISNSSGFGVPYENDLDYHTFGPFCHVQYSALEGNFQGGNSIIKRCIGQRHVHEYVLNYTRALLKHRLRRRRQHRDLLSKNSSPLYNNEIFFFDVLHLVEGHEGSHGVLYLVDDALTAFLEELRTELRFFDDPSNVLFLLSDHGNHMGPYYELTAPGKVERALPFVGMIFHTEMLFHMDHIKGYQPGESYRNLMQRTRRISTHLDLYATLADLFEVQGKRSWSVPKATVLPLSFFTARDSLVKVNNCEDMAALHNKRSGCYLAWCENK